MNNKIYNSVKKIKEGVLNCDEYYMDQRTEQKNEFIILIKPECFNNIDSMFGIINSIYDICLKNGVLISGFKAFDGSYAKENAYIENEYYVLNRSAHYGFDHVPFAYQAVLRKEYDGYNIISAYSFLNHAKKDYTAKSLEEVTEIRLSDKIGNGTYVLPIEYDNKKYAIINAFHPEQINHFYNPKHITVALFCQSDMDYKYLADNCIGNYVPERAAQSSIRYYLFQNQEYFNLTINKLFNGVHISPSPLEGIFGYYRYSQYYKADPSRSYLYRQILNLGVRPDQFFSLIENPSFLYNGKVVDIFGLCETKNAEEIVKIISELFI